MKDFKRNSKIIEFDKVLEMLASFTHTPLARERALSLTPFTYERKIERALDETDEAYDMSAHKGSPSFAGGYDVADSLSRAEKGAYLISTGTASRIPSWRISSRGSVRTEPLRMR